MERWTRHFQIDVRERPSISSNFFLKTNFLIRSFLKIPSCDPDSFIFRVFYDPSNCAKLLLEICMSFRFMGHTSTRIEYQFRESAHMRTSSRLASVRVRFSVEQGAWRFVIGAAIHYCGASAGTREFSGASSSDICQILSQYRHVFFWWERCCVFCCCKDCSGV